MSRLRPSFILFMISAVALVGFQNCSSPASFTESSTADAASTAPATSTNTSSSTISIGVTESCTTTLQTIKVPVKVLFVVDKSGSNRSATDPSMRLRGDAIQSFFDAYKAKTNFYWGIVLFNDSSASSLIGSSAAYSFSNNTTTMQSAINEFYTIEDTGGTPYRVALQKATSVISADAQWTANAKYIVVFISDGVPDPAVADSVLFQDVANLMAAHSGQTTLNTIYYGGASSEASQRLQNMATKGGGRFLDASSSTSSGFQIEDAISISGVDCQ